MHARSGSTARAAGAGRGGAA
eukprot:COSAG02_NODE_2111_length_9804_cov_5.586296_1_plen_20_part_10